MSHDTASSDPAPAQDAPPAPAFASSDDAENVGREDRDDRDRNRRRRGSRGGRKRRRPVDDATAPSSDGDERSEYDRRPNDLPDSPFEGVASGEGARRAEVGSRPGERPPRRPQIGDSRPFGTPGADVDDVDAGDLNSVDGVDGEIGASKRAPRSANPRPSNPRPSNRGPKPPKSAASSKPSTAGASQGGVVALRSDSAEPADGSDEQRNANSRTNNKRRRRSPEGRVESDLASPTGEPTMRRGGTERNGRPTGRYLMCVHTRPKATQIAVLEGRSLIEHYVSRPADSVGQIHGNIYLGRVQNVLPGMEAAFVDIGTPKNAVLYRADLQLDADLEGDTKKTTSDARIEQLLRNGQMVLCQVTKNPIGSKGARLTQEVSIPGRFVVFIPNSDTYGISKRLPDDERRRLRSVLDSVRPAGHGLIVRTAAEGANADELRRDVQMLVRQWERIDATAKKSRTPTLLHREPDIAVRVIREEFNRNYRGVVIDDRELFEEVRDYVASITPELADRVEYHDPAKEQLPIFEKHHVHEQLHKAIDRKVWLPSGGSLIIERTEALTVIDVNTGKNVGSSSLEETVFRNNLEAADEIARQLRLRDIGGIIVIDFIDMETRSNRSAVVTAFRSALSRDKTRTQVFEISELGLVEMTRKRISEGLVESLSDTCPTCEGRGFVYDGDLTGELDR